MKANIPIEIEVSSELEAAGAKKALTELCQKLTPKGVIKLLNIYNTDLTIRTVVNKKLGI